MSDLYATWVSTGNLYDRFNLTAKEVPAAKRRRFLNEEVLEVIEASLEDAMLASAELSSDRSRDAICEELADVLVTGVGLLMAHGVTLKQFQAAVARTNAKNDAKTPETHEFSQGKIRRKQT